MRRSERTSDRYDYKVLNTIGTTEQDKHPLYKSNSSDITDQVIQSDGNTVQINIEPSLNSEDNSERTASDAEQVEEHTNITNVHHSDEGSSNLGLLDEQHQQHINTPSDSINVNHTGDQASSSNNTFRTTTAMDLDQLTIDEATVSEDIDDFLDENDVLEVGDNPGDFDSLVKRAELYRTSFRGVHKQLSTVMGIEPYEQKYKEVCADKLDSIKKYLKDLKRQRKKLQESTHSAKTSSDKAKYDFLLKEFDSTFKELIKYFITDDSDWEGLSDEDLTRRRQCLDGKEKVIHSLSATVRDLVGMTPDEANRKSIMQNYESLRTAKTEYTKRLDEVVKKRQLDQKKAFNRSKLNIVTVTETRKNLSRTIHFMDFHQFHLTEMIILMIGVVLVAPTAHLLEDRVELENRK